MTKLNYIGSVNGKFILKGGAWTGVVVRNQIYDVPDALTNEFLKSGNWKLAEELPKSKIKTKIVEVKEDKKEVKPVALRCRCWCEQRICGWMTLQYKSGKFVETYNVWVLLDGDFIDSYSTYTSLFKEELNEESNEETLTSKLEEIISEDEEQ